MTAQELTVRVNGIRWRYVRNLLESGPRDRHFTIVHTADGGLVLTKKKLPYIEDGTQVVADSKAKTGGIHLRSRTEL